MGEGVELRHLINPARARLFQLPQRVQRRADEVHGKDDKVHRARKVFQLFDVHRQQQAQRTQHQGRTGHRQQHLRRLWPQHGQGGAQKCGNDDKGRDLNEREHGGGHELAQQDPGAWQGRREQQSHQAQFAVIHHGQARLHAVEEQHHAHQTRCDVDVIRDVGLVGLVDGHTKNIAKPRSKNRQP